MLVLVCDDDDLLRASVARVLAGAGHVVLEAGDGLEALALMRSERPDVVLLDMLLDEAMSGWQVAHAKKNDPAIAGIPTIVLSGMAPSDVRDGTAGPAASVLSEILLILGKPVENRTLVRALDHIEALKHLERA